MPTTQARLSHGAPGAFVVRGSRLEQIWKDCNTKRIRSLKPKQGAPR